MKLDYLKNKKGLVSVVLLGVSVFSGLVISYKVVGFFVMAARAENVVKKAVAQQKLDANDMQKVFAGAVSIADGLKKNNLFAPTPPKQHPVREVLGIMGNEVLIGENWYKLGDRIGDAKIVAIEPAQVRIEWEGNTQVFAPISSSGSGGPGGPGRGRPDMREMAKGGTEGAPPVVNINITAPGGSMPGGFGEFSPDRTREGFEGMRARFENMSEEERQAFRERMRNRPRGEGGPGGGPGGGRRRPD
jgi:hypothetical protein